MDMAGRAFHWLWGNTQPIFQLLAAMSVAIGALAYWRNSRLERARWRRSLYSKFDEALDLKMIRETLTAVRPTRPRCGNWWRMRMRALPITLNSSSSWLICEPAGSFPSGESQGRALALRSPNGSGDNPF